MDVDWFALLDESFQRVFGLLEQYSGTFECESVFIEGDQIATLNSFESENERRVSEA